MGSGGFLAKVGQNLLDDIGVVDAGNDLHRALAAGANFNVDVECGYPGTYNKGDVIEGLPVTDAPDAKVFHAGTALEDDKVVTSGGRVLCVTALGGTVAEAQKHAYEIVRQIHWKGAQYRHDIGYRAIAREKGINRLIFY